MNSGEQSAELTCPHCGETVTIVLDLSVASQSYVEDCSVCCRPMAISYAVEDGELAYVSAESEQ